MPSSQRKYWYYSIRVIAVSIVVYALASALGIYYLSTLHKTASLALDIFVLTVYLVITASCCVYAYRRLHFALIMILMPIIPLVPMILLLMFIPLFQLIN